MASHDVDHEVFYSGSWHNVSGEILQEANTILKRGLDQFGDLRAGTMAWTFLDPADKWAPDNPMSPLYGIAQQAMPCRVTVDGVVRQVGEAAVYAPQLELGQTTRVEFRADGLLARIGSWTEPLRSPMYRAISRQPNLIGHWPMEEGRDAELLSNTVPGGAAATAKNMTFGVDDAPAGASSAVEFNEPDNTSRIDFTFLPASATAGWQFAWSMQLPANPGATTLQILSLRTSNGYRWILNTLTNTYQIKVVDNTGALLEETNVGFAGTGEPNQWVTFRLKATASGGTVSVEFAWYVQGDVTPWGTSGTFSGTVGYLVNGSMNGNAYMDGAQVSHLYAVTTGADDLLSYAVRRAFDGYVGETAADRFGRLLDEEGIGWSIVGTAADTMPMGRQQADTLSGLLQEIAETDRCLIYDSRTAVELELRTRADLYRQTPLELTWPDDFAPPFSPRHDYVGVANRVTASQRDGGEATAALESGAMSVQPAPDGIGERKAGIDVNVADESNLALLAAWELAQGTLQGPRFPELTFDLDGSPGIAAAIAGLEIGDRLVINGFRYDALDLLVLGMREQVRNHRRTITLNCVPGSVFSQVGEYDAADSRYDSGSTTLKNAVVATFGDTFEDGAGTWSGSDATVAASTAQAHSGSGSLLITAVGTPAQSYVRDYSRAIPATPGTTYRTAMWVRSPQALSVIAAIDGVDAGFGYIGGGYSATTVLVANTWTRLSVAYTADVGVTQIICGPTILTPANGNTLYLDDIVAGAGAAVPDLLTFRTADVDDIWDTTAEPYEVLIAGERLRVEQMGTATLVSGEYDQSAICTRAINGVFKELPAASEIHIATPGRYGL